jgi:hypothetical protein
VTISVRHCLWDVFVVVQRKLSKRAWEKESRHAALAHKEQDDDASHVSVAKQPAGFEIKGPCAETVSRPNLPLNRRLINADRLLSIV